MASWENAVGFEWILMLKLPGKRFLDDVWKTTLYPTKKKVLEELAIYSLTLFKKQLWGIGNIYPASISKRKDGDEDASNNNDLPDVKRIVSLDFYWEHRLSHPIPRASFCCSKDWITAHLSCLEHNCHSTLSRCSNEEEELDTGKVDDDGNGPKLLLKIVNRLKFLVDVIFASSAEPELEPSMLFNDNLYDTSILVDGACALTGVVDWKTVSAVPLWRACDYPQFLGSPSQTIKPDPDRDNYYEEDPETVIMCRYNIGNPDTLYWEHLQEYELTMLRQHYLNEMGRPKPDWMQVFEASVLKREFDMAVAACEFVIYWADIDKWIHGITSGTAKPGSLEKCFERGS